MKNFSLTILFTFFFFIAFSQERIIELSSERQSDNSVDITYRKTAPGSYTVILDFSDYTNTSKPSPTYVVNAISGTLTTLRPTDKQKSIGYKYSYTYIRGALKPRIDKDFYYLLPYPPDTKCEAAEAGFANEKYFGAEKPADWKSYFFYTESEQVVTAARGGVVIEIDDKHEYRENVEYTTNRNAVFVEHKDGTIGRYLGFKKGSLKVKPGDEVFPGMPLGLNTGAKTRFGISLHIYYLNSVDTETQRSQTLAKPKNLYASVTPKFATGVNSCAVLENRKAYQSFSNEDLITKEMNKRALKRYKGQ